MGAEGSELTTHHHQANVYKVVACLLGNMWPRKLETADDNMWQDFYK